MEKSLQKTCVIYCRVSSKEQVEGTSLESQERFCTEYAERNKLQILKTYIERGESAKTANRTKFNEAITYCTEKKGRVNYFIVLSSTDLLVTKKIVSPFEQYSGKEHLRNFAPSQNRSMNIQ